MAGSSGSRAAAPLGVFDSGLGGLTVAREIRRALPNESILYLGDTARVPYGTRSAETVLRYARSCAGVLVERGIKALVVACNTVSAVAVDMLRVELDLPVIGVVEPGAEAALAAAEGALARDASWGALKIGVLGTVGTIASGAYPRAVGQRSTRWEVIGQAAPLLVPLAEEGWLEGQVPELAARRYVEPLVKAGVRAIVLGCTHYPLLKPVIERAVRDLAGHDVPVVDSAEATARTVSRYIAEGRIEPRGARIEPASFGLLVTDRPASFQAVAERFFDSPLPMAEAIDL